MIIILDNIRSAHNVGSIIRTCDALGIKEIHLCGISPGLSDKKVGKTSLGAERSLKILEIPDTYHDLIELRQRGYQIIGLEISERAVEVSKLKASNKSALVIGNEVSGLSEEIMNLCDDIVQIKMQGIKESLNVAVAFGIAAYELKNQNNFLASPPPNSKI